MEKIEYASNHMKSLLKLARRRKKINDILHEDNITAKRRSSLIADLNLISMHIDQDRERIGYALGFINIEDIRDEWVVSGFHNYRGIKEELENLNFY